MNEQLDNLRYPIGQFEYGKPYTIDDTRKHIKILSKFPKELKKAVKKLKSGDLEKTYRPGGWTVRQVILHLADSHINAYTRLKLAVTENTPIIKPYEENLWAELEDGKHGSVKTSLKLLSALHSRWTHFLKSLQEDDLEKGYYHPASKRTVPLQEAIALYVWHSQHHLGHIQLVAEGKAKAPSGKKAEEEDKKGHSDKKTKSDASAKTPKKRVISDEHREKIRAAQVARHAKKAGIAQETPAAPATSAPKRGRKAGVKAAVTAPTTAAAEAPKRGRKPGVKAAAAAPTTTTTEAPKRGRKPGVKAAAAAPTTTATEAPKRGRKPGVKAAVAAPTTTTTEAPKRGRKPGVKAAVAAPTTATTEAPKRGRKPGVKAAAAAPTTATTEAPKRGRKPGVKAVVNVPVATADTTKRKRRTKEEMEAARTTAPVTTKAPKAPKAPKVAKASALNADGTPKKRGLSPERMAEIRALRGVKKAETATTAAPVKAAKAVKAVKAPATNGDGAPKKRGLSPERMAEIRALRGAKKTAEAKVATPKAPKVPKAVKVAKAPALNADGTPKKRGLSPERMAEIRALRGKK
ncbi:MAG: putative metal-dependent hydrolase [Lewinellaceae bacterium]|nr:putative metal-dependent hydrolase [Lewinellaceae bacterium]